MFVELKSQLRNAVPASVASLCVAVLAITLSDLQVVRPATAAASHQTSSATSQTGTLADIKAPRLQLAQQTGTTDARQCPPGTRGRYPNCIPKKRCPRGTVGKYPVCIKIVKPKCESPTYGIWPNCKRRVADPPRRCPKNTYGKYPNCKRRIVEPKRKCPSWAPGKYPNCKRKVVRPRKPKKQITSKPPRRKITKRPTRRAPKRSTQTAELDQRPDEVVVLLDLEQDINAAFTIAQQYRLIRLEGEINSLLQARVQRYRIPDQRSVADVIAEMTPDPRVRYVEPNYIYRLFLYRLQSGGGKMSKPPRGSKIKLQYAVPKMGLESAHALSTGKKIRVAVIDSGIDTSHPELNGAVAKTYNAARGSPSKPDSHGTAVAGIVAARGELKGVAPSADLLAVRTFFREKGKKDPLTTTFILQRAFHWSSTNKADVLNLSFAGPKSRTVEDLVKSAHKAGLVMVAAAGNKGPEAPPTYPAAFPEVLAVTAIDKRDHLYKKANQGDHIAVAAPGVNILAPVPRGGYDFKTGTSFAAPHVSGLVALLLERNPGLTLPQIRAALKNVAVDLGPVGPDPMFGSGLADALGSLNAVVTGKLTETDRSIALPSRQTARPASSGTQ